MSEEFVTENPDHIGKVTYVSVYKDHLTDKTLSDEDMKKWQSAPGQVFASIRLKN